MIFRKIMACRPGPLRAGRSLRDAYIPLVGAIKIPNADQREAHGEAPIQVTK
jgi:hypothetical protein